MCACTNETKKFIKCFYRMSEIKIHKEREIGQAFFNYTLYNIGSSIKTCML